MLRVRRLDQRDHHAGDAGRHAGYRLCLPSGNRASFNNSACFSATHFAPESAGVRPVVFGYPFTSGANKRTARSRGPITSWGLGLAVTTVFHCLGYSLGRPLAISRGEVIRQAV
jgi:hypothetical protein